MCAVEVLQLPLLFYGKTMKTIAYIDGGNLYHGQLPEAVLLPNARAIHRPPAWA